MLQNVTVTSLNSVIVTKCIVYHHIQCCHIDNGVSFYEQCGML